MAEDKGQWYWNASPDPFGNGQTAQWTPYSQEDNDLIEQKFNEFRFGINVNPQHPFLPMFAQFSSTDRSHVRSFPTRFILFDNVLIFR